MNKCRYRIPAALLLAFALLTGCAGPAGPAVTPELTVPTAQVTSAPTADMTDGTRSAVFRLDRDGFQEDLHFTVTWKDGRAEPMQRQGQTLLRVKDGNTFVLEHVLNLYLLDFERETLDAFLPEDVDRIRWADIQAEEETADNKSRWASAPSMSPDGSLLLYQTDRAPGGVRLYSFETREDRWLTQACGSAGGVVWNGEASVVLRGSEKSLAPALYEVSLSDGSLRPLTGELYTPQWAGTYPWLLCVLEEGSFTCLNAETGQRLTLPLAGRFQRFFLKDSAAAVLTFAEEEYLLSAYTLGESTARQLLRFPAALSRISVTWTQEGKLLLTCSDPATGETEHYELDPAGERNRGAVTAATPAPTPEPTARPAPSPKPTLSPTAAPEPTPELTPGEFAPVTAALGEDWPYLPKGAVKLSPEEIAEWQAWFAADWMRTQFLTSAYERPEDVDLFQLFYNGADLRRTAAPACADPFAEHPEEGAYLLKRLGWWNFAADTVRLPRTDVDALLRRYLGLGLEEVSRVGLNWPYLFYLPETDAWYTAHGDTNRQEVKLLYGYRLGEEVSLFHMGIAFYQSEDPWSGNPDYSAQVGVFRTVLRPGEAGEDFRFVSNLLALTDGTETRYAPPGSVNPSPLDLSGDYGGGAFRLEPETMAYRTFGEALVSLFALDGFEVLLERDFPDYGTLVYGTAEEGPCIFFVSTAGVRYRLHLPVTRLGTVPLDPEQNYGRADRGEVCVLDDLLPDLVDWITGCVAYTDLGNGELRRMGEARWTLYLPTMEEFVCFTPYLPRTPLHEMELIYRDVAIGDTVERMREVLGEPEEVTEHLNTSPEPPEGLEYREYRYSVAIFREAYTEAEGWTGTVGQIEIRDTSLYPGPRGILIGETPESILDLFPREFDYREDALSRFYGLPGYEGAGGTVYQYPEGEILAITLTTDGVEPFLRIDFKDGRAERIFMGYSWV